MNRTAQKKLREEQRQRVLGANTDVKVFHKDRKHTLKTHEEQCYVTPFAYGTMNPAILPVHVIEDGLGPGQHEVQIAFEHTMCSVDADGTHTPKPYTLVLKTSLASFAATAQRAVEELGPGVNIELPFAMDLYQQDAEDAEED